MAYELSWQNDNNRQYNPADSADICKYRAWYHAAFLLGNPNAGGLTGSGLWVYEGCSNGTYGAMSASAIDFWGAQSGTYASASASLTQTTSDPTTNALSWIALRSPTANNGFYDHIIIGLYGNALANYSVWHSTISWSLAVNTQRLPTSSLWTPPGTANPASHLATSDNTTVALHSFNGSLADNGQYVIWNGRVGQGSTKTGRVDIWAPLTGVSTNDQFPFYTYCNYDSSNGFLAPTNLYQGASPRNYTRNFNNSPAWNSLLAFCAFAPSGIAKRDLMTGAVWDFPFYVYASDNSAYSHTRGRVKDLSWIPFDGGVTLPMAPEGSVFKENGVVKYATLGIVMFPWSGSIAL